MKRKSILILSFVTIILSSIQTTNAQSWNLTGNSNATTSSKLGTTNTKPLRLMTNNQTRIYVNGVTGDVGIGTGDNSNLNYRLVITDNANGIYGSGSIHGVMGVGDYGIYGDGGTYGVYGTGVQYGVAGISANNYGVYGNSGYLGVFGSGGTYGVYGFSITGQGVKGYSINDLGGYFYSSTGFGLRAATGVSGGYAGVFDGSVFTFGGYVTSSDKNLKQNIADFGNAMDIINKLKPKNYEFRTNDERFASFNLPKGTHYGLIAQDVEQVLPNLVKESPQEVGRKGEEPISPDSNNKKVLTAAKKEVMNIKGVNYEELIPILIKAMQEQDTKFIKRIEEQDAKIEELTQLMKKLQGSASVSSGAQSNVAVKLSSASLDQNIPNPLNNSTSIGYNLPAGTSKALLSITDNNGNIVKQIPLNSKGKGAVNIEASTLSAGTYLYTLIVDGKTVETKRMIVAR